jgi:general secretion pathway protein D
MVTIGLALEVSSVGSNVGTTDDPQYEINTRRSNTKLQLKNRETVLIGGLIQDDDVGEVTKIPLLGDIPILRRLFSRDYRSKTKTEVLMSITPHVVRGVDMPGESVLTMWSGQENIYSLKGPIFETETGKEGAKEENIILMKETEKTYGSVFISAPSKVKIGEKVPVQILVKGMKQLYAAPFDIVYDKYIIRCLEIREGPFFSHDGKQTAFLTSIHQHEGRANVNASRMGKVGGVDGSGVLAYLIFEAVGQGHTKIFISNQKFLDSDMNAYPIEAKIVELNVE